MRREGKDLRAVFMKLGCLAWIEKQKRALKKMRLLTAKMIVICLCCFFPAFCNSYEPVFKAGVLIEANDIPLDAGTYSVPNAYDWNNDGRKDLLVGFGQDYDNPTDQTKNGRIRLYLNSGTNSSPILTDFTFLQAAGTDINHPFY